MADSAQRPHCDHRFMFVTRAGFKDVRGWRCSFVVWCCEACGAEQEREETRVLWPPAATVTLEAADGR